MSATNRFLVSTRGRILTRLLREPATVAELAEAFGISANAARQHVTGLERDGYVERFRTRPTTSRPAAVYRPTPEGEALFPKGYAPVLDAVVAEYAEAHGGEREMAAFLRDVGHRLGRAHGPPEDATREERIDAAVALLADLGGVIEVGEGEGGVVWLDGHGCPLSAVVKHHPEFCAMVAVMLEEMIALPVEQCCRNEERNPSCRFAVGARSPG
ncbi:MAG TPA: ArsR family transcriptional regulator [Alphaproteobacteria bacterium]|nr:ArsR family transcriptional regulator [Alphaproteobacteria bacterium]